ncbi:MAG: hypothetical protein WCT42_00155 [Candidatus Paceibacterota bacterium]
MGQFDKVQNNNEGDSKKEESNDVSPAYLEIMDNAEKETLNMIEVYKKDSRLYERNFNSYKTKLFYNSKEILEGKAGSGQPGSVKDHLLNNREWISQYKNMEIFVRAAEIMNPEEGKKLREQIDIVYKFMNKKG